MTMFKSNCPKCGSDEYIFNSCYGGSFEEPVNYCYFSCGTCGHTEPEKKLLHFIRVILNRPTYKTVNKE